MFIVQPTCPPVNENLMELLIMIDSFKRASAERITAVIPYFGYARQDRKDEGRVPITAKLVANLITRAGADRVLAMDLHAAQIQGFFDIPVDHLYAAPVIDEHFKQMDFAEDDFVVVSPDEGSIKRALAHVARLGGQLAIIDKRRSSAEKTKQANVIGGPVEGKVALIFDDMISTAGSICGAAEVMHQARRQGDLPGRHARHLLSAARSSGSKRARSTALVITDTIPLPPEKQIPEDQGPQRRPAAGRGDQADPPQRIGQPAVRSAEIAGRLRPTRLAGTPRRPRCRPIPAETDRPTSRSTSWSRDASPRLLLRFSVPAIVGMVVQATYNVVDRIFIGQAVGSLGIAAITVAFPVMLVLMAFGMLIGFGATALVSIRLGSRQKAEAERILGNALVLLVAVFLALAGAGIPLAQSAAGAARREPRRPPDGPGVPADHPLRRRFSRSRLRAEQRDPRRGQPEDRHVHDAHRGAVEHRARLRCSFSASAGGSRAPPWRRSSPRPLRPLGCWLLPPRPKRAEDSRREPAAALADLSDDSRGRIAAVRHAIGRQPDARHAEQPACGLRRRPGHLRDGHRLRHRHDDR